MKYIIKLASCEPLDTWRADLEATEDPNIGYSHPGFPRQQVIAALLEDQGNICAYTMQRIGPDSCHIEHIKPQTICRGEDRERKKSGEKELLEEIAWNNILACYPAPLKRGQEEPGYGARQRGSWWDKDKFMSPLRPDCEERVRFTTQGLISAADALDIDANTTITKMNLKHGSLCEQRENAIKSMGLHPLSEDPLSPNEAKEFVENVWKSRVDSGFLEFCVALRDAAKEHLHSLEKQFELTST